MPWRQDVWWVFAHHLKWTEPFVVSMRASLARVGQLASKEVGGGARNCEQNAAWPSPRRASHYKGSQSACSQSAVSLLQQTTCGDIIVWLPSGCQLLQGWIIIMLLTLVHICMWTIRVEIMAIRKETCPAEILVWWRGRPPRHEGGGWGKLRRAPAIWHLHHRPPGDIPTNPIVIVSALSGKYEIYWTLQNLWPLNLF